MSAVYQFLTFLVVLGIIVLVHELGHYIAARLMKIRVEVFSFGFGKRLFGKKIGDTDFRVSLVPVGGYVRLAGEEDFDPEHPAPDQFMAKNRGQKIFTLVMGPVMNLVLALLLIIMVNMGGVEIDSYKLETPVIGYVEKGSPAAKADLRPGDVLLAINGKKTPDWKEVEITIGTNPQETLKIDFSRDGAPRTTELKVATRSRYEIGYAGFYWQLPAVIGDVVPDYPAQKAGLRPGDRITAVDGRTVANYFALADIIHQSAGRPLQLAYRRNGSEASVSLTPVADNGVGVIGFNVRIASTTVRYGLGAAVQNSFREAGRLMFLTINAFKKIIQRKISVKSFSGPIEIARVSQQALESGFANFFMLIAFISLQLGMINLFPIPGLDGGHLLIFTIEAAIRRDLNARLKSILLYAGFAFLISLMVFIVLNDIAKTLPRGWQSLLPFLG
ncbi:MAG: RIP metalloprotease RseP [Candidatus Aminicenantes bacterium]|nr:RIP metalloprotease RseP [Candidatus Aminicenantes bacterium]